MAAYRRRYGLVEQGLVEQDLNAIRYGNPAKGHRHAPMTIPFLPKVIAC